MPHTMAIRSAQANTVAITQPRSSLRPRVSSGEKKSTRPTCGAQAGGVAGQRQRLSAGGAWLGAAAPYVGQGRAVKPRNQTSTKACD